MKYDIDELVSGIDFDSGSFIEVSKNVLLTKKEIEVLSRYKVNYQSCSNLKEIIYMIESILDDMDIIDEDLELVSESISERDYYQNTNK